MPLENKKSNLKTGHTLEAYNGIRQMLFHNEIAPGQKLAYRDLAKKLGMSITPVTQALRLLEFQGLVRHENNRGYSTEPVNLHEVEEIYDLRLMIEVSLLTEGMSRLDETGILKLKTSLEAHSKAIREKAFSQRLIEHRNFHITLASLSNMRIQVRILMHLFDLLYLKYGGIFLFSSYIGTTDTEHREIFNAVVSKDLKLSQKLLSNHIKRVKTRVISDFGRMIGEKITTEF